MTGSFLRLVSLADVIDHDLETARGEQFDRGVFGEVGTMEPPLMPALPIEAYKWGHTLQVPRAMAVDFGLVEPTPQEAADMATSRAWARKWHADRIQRRAAWFSAVRDALYPDAVAMLDLHVPDELLDDCETCTVDPYDARVPWPCATVLAAAQAVGVPEPEGV